MAHSRSALKRWRQSLKRRDHNRSIKSRTRTLLNKALVSVGTDEAEESVKSAVSALDSAAQKGIIHLNAAARSKSRLLKRYNLATATAVAAAAASEAAPESEAPRRRTTRRASGESSSGGTSSTRSTRSRSSSTSKDAPKTPRSRTRKSE